MVGLFLWSDIFCFELFWLIIKKKSPSEQVLTDHLFYAIMGL